MKLPVPFSGSSRHRSQRLNEGFTLPEILIAMTVFLLVVGAILSANLFGLRMFQMTNTKLKVTQWSRLTIEKLTDQIHGCNSLSILNVDTNGNFTGLLDGETQQGNALQIYPTANTNNYIIYFVNLADQTFRRTTNQTDTGVILADSVTNTLPFSAQNLSGTVLTNNNNQVIHLILEFHQPAHFMQDADYYKLETSIKQRVVQ